MRRVCIGVVLGVSLALVSCADEQDSPADAQSTQTPVSSRPNLLTLDRGVVVSNRTGEIRLDASTIHTIDGDPKSSWITPPKDPAQSITIALPAASTIEQIGLAMGPGEPPRAVVFERSVDGQTFVALETLETPAPGIETFEDVRPVPATHLRVRIEDPTQKTVNIRTIAAAGSETAPFNAPSISGSWSINGVDASFAQKGPHVYGEMQTEPLTRIEGSWSGRVILFTYLRGKEYGLGAIAVSPDGASLNALWWYQQVKPLHIASAWFGRKTDSAGGSHPGVADAWLEQLGWTPVPGIVFEGDGSLSGASSSESLEWLVQLLRSPRGGNVLLRKRDLNQANPEESRQAGKRQLEALLAELKRRGADVSRVTLEPLAKEGLDGPSEGTLPNALLSMVEVHVGSAGTP